MEARESLWTRFKDFFRGHPKQQEFVPNTQALFDRQQQQNFIPQLESRWANMERYGNRGDLKSSGYFGALPMADGRTATEISIGERGEMPLLVPGLNRNQIDSLLYAQPNERPPEMNRMADIARQHAAQRESEGKSPFWKTGEPVTPLPDYENQAPPYRPLPPEKVNITTTPSQQAEPVESFGGPDEWLSSTSLRKPPKVEEQSHIDSMLDDIAKYEGFVPRVNYDKVGKGSKVGGGSIGYGTQITDPAIQEMMRSLGMEPEDYLSGKKVLTREEGKLLLVEGMNNALKDAKQFLPNFADQPAEVQRVLVNMSYNMGLPTLNEFKKFKTALSDRNYGEAAKQMKDSAWYSQTGQRARDLYNTVKTYST